MDIPDGKAMLREYEYFRALQHIANVLCNDKLSDFDCVDQIVDIMGDVDFDCGGRHDFG